MNKLFDEIMDAGKDLLDAAQKTKGFGKIISKCEAAYKRLKNKIDNEIELEKSVRNFDDMINNSGLDEGSIAKEVLKELKDLFEERLNEKRKNP